jgi:hypothetical protein
MAGVPDPAAGDADRAPDWFESCRAPNGPEIPQTRENVQASRRRDGNAEARIQAAIVEWIRLAAPSVLVFSVPNGGLRSKAEAARMRWTGLLAGAPDLTVIASNGRAHFLEVKAPGGSLSRDQRDVHGALTALGTPPAIVRSINDVRRAFAAWGIETREAAR